MCDLNSHFESAKYLRNTTFQIVGLDVCVEMPKGLGLSVLPSDAGVLADISNLFISYEMNAWKNDEEYIRTGGDHEEWKNIMLKLRLGNIWRGRGSEKEIMTVCF